jgi:hypothetical protein
MMVLWLWLSLAFGGTLSDGADRFSEGDLAGAAAVLMPAAESGWGSGRLHFNLGNVYYRKGELPLAIHHYRAAQRLRPRDGNVHHNLALARSELKGLPDPVGLPSTWMSLVTVGELAVLGWLSTTVGSVWVVAWFRRKQTLALALPGAALVGVGLGIGAMSLQGVWTLHRHPVAVVTSPSALVRDAARTDGEERFRLAPGSEVSVIRGLDPFLLVEDGEGRRGWVSVSAVEINR